MYDRCNRRHIVLVIMNDLQPVNLDIDGVLDLHSFQPREIKPLIIDYLFECRKKKILRVKIIHGKGTGSLRRSLHSILGKLPIVDSFHLAGDLDGSWGATIVHIVKSSE